MNVLFYIANGLVMPPAMFFMYNYYKFKGKGIDFAKLPVSVIIITVTIVVTSLQFVFPAIIPLFERNREALLAGEVWRLVTPLFIQPLGLWQCLFNGVFIIVFLPLAEHFYGRYVVLIYFGAGLVGQLVNMYWLAKITGGSSTAIYGVIGALFMYILLHRKKFPPGYQFLSIAGFMGAVILCFFKDGHAPALLAGAMLSLLKRNNTRLK